MPAISEATRELLRRITSKKIRARLVLDGSSGLYTARDGGRPTSGCSFLGRHRPMTGRVRLEQEET